MLHRKGSGGRMSLVARMRDILVYSEPVKWATQNAIGLVIPLLFVVLKQISFSSACTSAVFYGVSSQAFSIDRTVGGRIFGGFAFIGVVLAGGVLGFAVVSLSWLARGSSVPLEGLSAVSADSDVAVLSSAYWILLMVLHVAVYFILTFIRAISSGLDLIYITVCQSIVSALTLTGMGLMPSLGQTRFWTQAYSPMIKSALVNLLAVFANSMLLYVKSSHDQLREQIGEMCLEIGKLFSKFSSGFHLAVTSKSSLKQYVDWNTEVQRVKTTNEIIKMSLDANTTNALCMFEPAWPFFCSQVGGDRAKYAKIIEKLQVFLGTVKSMEILASTLMREILQDGVSTDLEKGMLEVASKSLATITAAIVQMEAPLRMMPFGGVCQGDALKWRPHSLEFWNSNIKYIADYITSIMGRLRSKALDAVEMALEKKEDGKFRGDLIGLLVAVENLMDECIDIEMLVAHALEIKDLNFCRLEGDLKGLTAPSEEPSLKRRIGTVATSPYASPLIVAAYEATGFHIWITVIKNFSQGMHELKVAIRGLFGGKSSEESEDIVSAACRRRLQKRYLKLFLAHNLAAVAIILIGWYEYANTDSYTTNATNLSSWYSKWQPQYFVLATAVCVQDTVDSGVIKAMLRVSLIALGGSLGYATVVNGSLAQNAYYMIFISILVNGFFGLFAFISFDLRYSLFLIVYTWNAIAICTYTGTCCTPGNVHKFGGRAASTAIGAVYAFVISNLVFPVYSSQLAFEYEGSLASSYIRTLDACCKKGLNIFGKATNEVGKNEEDGGSLNPKYPYVGVKINVEDQETLDHYIQKATTARLNVISNLYKEVKSNSLDSIFVLFVNLTLIPLPRALSLIFGHLAKIGSYTNLSVKALYSSVLKGKCSKISLQFVEQISKATDAYFSAASEVCDVLIRILVEKTTTDQDFQNLAKKLENLEACRVDLHTQYLSTLSSLLPIDEWRYGDLRCLTWYAMLSLAVQEVGNLSLAMVKEPAYRDKGGGWIMPSIRLPSNVLRRDQNKQNKKNSP